MMGARLKFAVMSRPSTAILKPASGRLVPDADPVCPSSRTADALGVNPTNCLRKIAAACDALEARSARFFDSRICRKGARPQLKSVSPHGANSSHLPLLPSWLGDQPSWVCPRSRCLTAEEEARRVFLPR